MGDDARLPAKATTLYYRSLLSQQQFMQRLGISWQVAGRLLRRAHDPDIMHIEIRSALSYTMELEYSLEEAFKLLEANVVRSPADTDMSVKAVIGNLVATQGRPV